MISFEVSKEAAKRASGQVGYRPDGTVLLALGAQAKDAVEVREARPGTVHYHPLKGTDLAQCAGQLAALRLAHPGLWLHGLSPGWVTRAGASLPAVDSLALYTGPLQGEEPAAHGWESLLKTDLPKVASLTYGPDDSSELLATRLQELATARRLVSVLLLPRSQGDRVMVAGATTNGAQDMAFVSQARLSLPAAVRVRASWAALGWKLAQASLCFGSDELAGWGLEEQLAYSGRGRPASVVEAAEVEAGIREARKEPRLLT